LPPQGTLLRGLRRVWAWARYHLDDRWVIRYTTSIPAAKRWDRSAPGQHAPVSWKHASGAIARKEHSAGKLNSKSNAIVKKRIVILARRCPTTHFPRMCWKNVGWVE